MKKFAEQYPYTAITVCLLLLFCGGFFEITMISSNWKGFIVFIISDLLFFFTINKAIKYIIFNMPQIKKAKLNLYELLEKSEDRFEKIEEEIVKERNSVICRNLQIVFAHQKSSQNYEIESIQNLFETSQIIYAIQNSTLSGKLKRKAIKYAKKYNNNIVDITELRIAYKNKSLLQNEIDIKNIIAWAISIFSAVVGILTFASFAEFLLTRIVNIILLSIIDVVHIIEIYRNNRNFYMEYYVEKTELIEKAKTRVEEKEMTLMQLKSTNC